MLCSRHAAPSSISSILHLMGARTLPRGGYKFDEKELSFIYSFRGKYFYLSVTEALRYYSLVMLHKNWLEKFQARRGIKYKI